MEGSLSEPTSKRVAVVTGANKGIGLEICKQLASNGVIVILTARDVTRGTEAVEKLKESGLSDVVFHQLDVTDSASVAALADFIKNQYQKLDILVNNAGVIALLWDIGALNACIKILNEEQDDMMKMYKFIGVSHESYETTQECLNINYYGTKRVTEALVPLLQLSPSPRIVNMSSDDGKLENIPNESIKKELGDVDNLTEERLEEIIQSYLRDVNQKKVEENGWPPKLSAYRVSKVAISAYTRILARKYPAFCINCVHPGYVRTDMTGGIGMSTVEEGAEGPVMLALAPEGSPSGNFYDQTQLSSFE